jgi:hypothetical protein
MAIRQVLLAPVPGEHIESAQSVPSLLEKVAFGSSKSGLRTAPIGLDVYVFVSQPAHRLYRRGAVSFRGTLGALVPAVEGGRRSGKHPDPSVRPPTAEAGDGAFLYFWEVEKLHSLSEPIPLTRFSKDGGGPPFSGSEPQWPVLAYLDT